MTDEQLMQLVKEGHLGRMSVLFERYNRPLYNFFYRLTYRQSLSEDLTQNVFERLLRYRQSFNAQYSFRSWIFRIARNVRAEHYKKNGQYSFDLIDQQKTDTVTDSIEKEIDDKEKIQLLEKALNGLDEDQREILLLTRYQGLRYSEVAQLLNCSEGAVKVRVFRAIKALRTIYLKAYEH